MTQASLPSAIESSLPDRPGRRVDGRQLDRDVGLTLWFFGLTAMTLVFASLLVLGLLVREGLMDSPLGSIASGYAVVLALIGLGATAYVVGVGRRLGVLRTEGTPARPAVPLDTLGTGLLVVPMTRPVRPLPMRVMAAGVRTRTSAPRATAAHRRTPAPWPTAPRPVPMPAAPAWWSNQAPPLVQPATANVRPSPVLAVRPRHASTAALQVRVAGLRAPFWDRPAMPTLVGRLQGQGTFTPSLTRATAPMPTPVPRRPRQRTRPF